MINKKNWDDTQNRMEAFWAKEYNGRCNLSMQAIKKYPSEIISQFTAEERFTNPEVVDIIFREICKNKMFYGESFPAKYVDFGTSAHCEFFGCKPKYGETTTWFESFLDEPDASLINANLENNIAYERQKSFFEKLIKLAKDDYFVSMSDNAGMIDAVAEIRGTENLLCDMLEEEEFVELARKKVTEAWKISENHYAKMIKSSNLGGCSHGWMQVWAPEAHVQLQCDFSVMISPSLFEQFVLPELEECSKAIPYSSYHLDGIEEIRHLDMILSVKDINNIQWTPVAGQPRTSEHIEVFKKIQKAGKGLIVAPQVDEVETILKNLSHRALQVIVHGVKDEEMAKDIIKMAEKYAND